MCSFYSSWYMFSYYLDYLFNNSSNIYNKLVINSNNKIYNKQKYIITEDYVSFEVAKLLKDKGFDEPCWFWYNPLGEFKRHYSEPAKSSPCYEIACPTIQMAMKWLRIKHNLSVEVYRTACGYIGCIVNIPTGTDIKFLEEDGDDRASGTYTKFEYACEAAIKYCLENLI